VNRLKFQFGDVTISPGGYLLVWCGQGADFPVTAPYPDGQVRATGFAISSGGEPIVLTAPDGATAIDEFPALVIGPGRSMGRGVEGQFDTRFFYDAPTPNAPNSTTGIPTETLAPPVFSVPGGMYTSDVTLALETGTGGAVIRYTTDGSDPTGASPVYDGPLTLTAAGNRSTAYSWVPTNRQNLPYDESWQPPEGEVSRINVIRARVFKDGLAPSRIATHSYLVDPAGAARYPFPVVSITADPGGLFGDETGIYVHGSGSYPNYKQDGSAWERAGQIEFFEEDGAVAFRGDMGVRLHGNNSVSRPRKSLRIYARDTAGAPFNHRIFPQKEIDHFSTFLLRNSGNDWGQAMLRDAFLTSLAAHTGVDHQSARPAVVFINGEYWGLHNLRDRIDEGYYLQHHGLGEMEFTQLDVHWQPVRPHWPVYDRGNPDPAMLQDFEDILNRAGSNEYSSAVSFAALAERIDVGNYIDYNVHQIFAGNGDWPGNNTRLWRAVNADRSPDAPASHDGRWRWILFDTDMGLGLDFDYVPGWNRDATQHAQVNTLALATSETQTSFANAPDGTLLLRKLTANPVFRQQFINRFADLLNTSLSPDRTVGALAETEALYGPGLAEHRSRWRQPYNWPEDIARIRTFLQARPAAVRGHIAGKFGLSGTADLTVDVSDTSQGSVTVNTIKIDPSTVGVSTNPYPWTGSYFQGVPVTVTAVPEPGYRFVSWSNMVSAGPSVVASDAAASYGSWTNGANGGTGFGPWSLGASTGDRNRAGTFLNNGRGGWGMYANDEQLSWAYRSLSSALQIGQTFSLRWRHGWVDWPGDVGFELANSSGGILFKLACYWWSDTYLINGLITDIPVTTSVLDIEVTLVTSDTYSARITPVGGATHTHTGTLLPETDSAVRRFLAYNYSAGNGGGADVFFSSMQVTSPGGGGGGSSYALFSTNATITPTLSNATTFVASFALEPATGLAITPPVWTTGVSNAPVTVRAVNSLGDTDASFTGPVALTLTGPGGFLGTYTATAVDGVATFAAVDLPAGSYTLSASAGALSTAAPVELSVRAVATFLPAGSGVWHLASNWDANAIPNSAAASVIIPPNLVSNRDVTNNAPTTIGAITFELGTSAFRNRITGTVGQPLTLASTSGVSTVTVTGTGSGHANIEVTNGVVFSNQVVFDVQNIGSTNAEYGALRLQGAISGPGAIVKRGPGMGGITGAGKTFSGNITIEQGVLTFSEPAITANNVTNYTVQPGGQLRLSSAGNPRNYLFKGPLHLAGDGRAGVPDNENLGVRGALRLEAGGTGTLAVLTNTINLTASADVHVPAGNAMQLGGPLTTSTNTNVLAKSGGGTLVLSSNASAFTGGLAVNRGVLRFDAAMLTNTVRPMVLTNETVLTGTGRWGGSLEARDGSALAFFPGLSPGDAAPLRAGSFAASGAVTIAVTPAGGALPGTYPLLAVDGSATGLGHLSLSLATTNFPAARLSFRDGTLYAVLSAHEAPAEVWLAQYGLPTDGTGEGADNADPDGDGVVNLVERALFLNPRVAEPGGWAVASGPEGEVFAVTYRVARNQNDLSVRAESSPRLGADAEWTPLVPEVADDTHPDYTVYRAALPQSGVSGFVRLKVTR
jgi:autotransporter-associated beta strand protein